MLKAYQSSLSEIKSLRNLFLQENNFQIRYNACHERGWSDSYLLTLNDSKIGYGSVKGKDDLKDRNAVFEFYLIPSFRTFAPNAFSELLKVSNAAFIECQSNDVLLTSLLYQFAENINSDVILFEEGCTTSLGNDKAVFRKRLEGDNTFEHKAEPVGDYILEIHGEVIATGGFLLHYNPPFADLFMEVKENFRRSGFGSLLIQEIKKECYLAGRVPAARCGRENVASKATLLKAGLKIAGNMLVGEVKRKT
jgi:hypothetical protein